MNKELFNLAMERASKEVLSFISDGYTLVLSVQFPEQETAYIQLRHLRNGNCLKIRVLGDSFEVFVNDKLTKKETC